MLRRGPCTTRDLGHRVLPVVLAGAAHHEQVAVAERPAQRGATATRAEPERRGAPRLTIAMTGVGDDVTVAVAVPGHRVVAVAVEVEADRVERFAVAVGEQLSGCRGGSASARAGRSQRSTTPTAAARRRSGRTSDAGALPERELGGELVEQPVGAGQPAGRVVDPGRLVEVEPGQLAERGVVLGLERPEQRSLADRRPGTYVRLVADVTDAQVVASRPEPTAPSASRCQSAPCASTNRQVAAPATVAHGRCCRPGSWCPNDADDAARRLPRAARHAARRRIEGDEFFIAEGPVAIERLIASEHRVRSVAGVRAEVRTAARPARPGSTHRSTSSTATCCTTSSGSTSTAGRSLPPTGVRTRRSTSSPATSRRLAVLEGLNDPENLGAIARSARALGDRRPRARPDLHRPVHAAHRPSQHGRDPAPAVCRVGDADWPAALGRACTTPDSRSWALTPGDDADDIWTLESTRAPRGPARRRGARAHARRALGRRDASCPSPDPPRRRLAQRRRGRRRRVRRRSTDRDDDGDVIDRAARPPGATEPPSRSPGPTTRCGS